MKELLPIPLYLPRQHEELNKQRHDLDDLDNLWYIKWMSENKNEKSNNGVIIFFN